jgi:hypothetical protein
MTAVAFLFLVFAFGAFCLDSSRDVLAKIAILGLFISLASLGDRSSFEALFYGKVSYHNFALVRHVGFGDLTFLLFGAMGCLLYVAFNEALDTEPARKRAIPGGFSGIREPKFVNAEIRPPKEKIERPKRSCCNNCRYTH